MGCSGIKSGETTTNPQERSSPNPWLVKAKVKQAFKVVFLGKSGVGKTSITLRYCRDSFQEGTEATIGASFISKTINLNERQVKFDIWDTAGQERYKSLTPMYFRNADAAVLVYDITDPESFPNIQGWYNDIRREEPDSVIMIVGNKLDLANDRRVSKHLVDAFAHEKQCSLIEVSSKTGDNVDELFNKLATLLTEKFPDKL